MNLTVRTFQSPLLEQAIHVLCDAQGNVLPNQAAVTVKHDDTGSQIVVTFDIDGKRVSVSEQPALQQRQE